MASEVLFFEHKINGAIVKVRAHHMPQQELWALICSFNQEAVETMQSEDPWADARGMIARALIDHEDVEGPHG